MPLLPCRQALWHLLPLIVLSVTTNAFTTRLSTRSAVLRPTLPYSNHLSIRSKPSSHTLLTTTAKDSNDGSPPVGPLQHAVQKFRARPGTYLLIPCVAAVVGWFTNWLAVQMIFYPIKFRGIPLWVKDEIPLGLLGWQGIVPCKTRPMAEAMVHMVRTQLLSVPQVFGRLNPRRMGQLLAPEVPKMGLDIVNDVVPMKWLPDVFKMVFAGLSHDSQSTLALWNVEFLTGLSASMQQNIESIFNLKNCVVQQMMMDRRLLGQLFQKCGQKELDFLTNSGLWFGFLLGVIQMVVALYWDNPWSLSIGGGIVGLATNWLALKWIFEPVNPTRFGPFILQGKFLRRQKEVAKEFSNFFATKILTSEKVWNSILTDPTTTPAFHKMFGEHFEKFLHKVMRGLRVTLEPEVVALATARAISKLPEHVGVLHHYIDNTLHLEDSLRTSMERMTSLQFERVLHPIFEEDELTLILAGAVLGFAAGLVQQGLETGAIQIPDLKPLWTKLMKRLGRPDEKVGGAIQKLVSVPRALIQRIRKGRTDTSSHNEAP